MHNYSAVYSENASMFAKRRRVWTGKAQGEQDDLLIALQLAIYFRAVYLSEATRN